MTANINPKTGIAYGYIAANALDSDLVNDLLQGNGVTGFKDDGWIDYKAACVNEYRQENEAETEDMTDDEVWDEIEMEACDRYESGETTVRGEYEGVHYMTAWLGGALNFFIFHSPIVTDKANRASPCVPNCGILDELDGDVTSYNVPDDWRRRD